MKYKIIIGQNTFKFKSLKDLLAKASPLRSADQLAQVAASSQVERVADKKPSKGLTMYFK